MWYFIVYGLFAVWVFWDARKRKNNLWAWPLTTFFLGPIILPFYFAKRNLKDGEVREGGTGWNVLKNFALLWTLTMFIAGIAGMIGAGSIVEEAATETEQAGAIIGAGLGLGMIFMLWFIPMIIAIIIGVFLKKSSIVENGPTGPLAELKEE
ncbi:MAG: hypothetical protein PWR10_1831 [Halanaerobiales bacterium]|nr:hypothetical protein [Halanaerobiales bacterium]